MILQKFSKYFLVMGLGLVVCFGFSGNVFAEEGPPASAGGEVKTIQIQPKLNIPIPDFSFSKQLISTDSKNMNFPFFGEYISAIYTWAVGFIALITILVIMVGGLKYSTARGNKEQIDDALDYIKGGVVGLLIAVGTYTLLYTINPELIKLKSLTLQQVERADISEALHAIHDVPDLDAFQQAQADNLAAVNAGAASRSSSGSVDCSAFPDTPVGRSACRKACNAALPPDKRSKLADSSYDDKYLGWLDCNSGGTRDLSAVKYIGIHEGKAGSGTITWWWYRNVGGTDGNGKYHKPGTPVGTHYFIDQLGKIYQLADESFIMSHGVLNKNSIGIDLKATCSSAIASVEESEKCSYSNAQYSALKKLIKQIASRTGVIYADSMIKGHCERGKVVVEKGVPIAKGHIDPRNFDWTKIGLNNFLHKKGVCKYVPGFPNKLPGY